MERGSFRGSSSGGMGVSGRMSSSSGGNYCSSGEGPTDQHAKIEQLDPPSCIERGAKRAAHLPQHCIGPTASVDGQGTAGQEESVGTARRSTKGSQQTLAPLLSQQSQQAQVQRPRVAQPAMRGTSKCKWGQHTEQQPQEALDQTPQRS